MSDARFGIGFTDGEREFVLPADGTRDMSEAIEVVSGTFIDEAESIDAENVERWHVPIISYPNAEHGE